MTANVLLVVEHDARGARHASLALAAPAARLARELGGTAAAVVTGSATADSALTSAPLATVYVSGAETTASLGRAIDSTVAAARASASTVILITETTCGRELAGGVAARLHAAILTSAHALAVKDGRLVVHAAKLGGNVLTQCAALTECVVVLVRPNALREEEPAGSPQFEMLDVAPRPRDVFIETQNTHTDERISLEEADVVVSGGRGLGGPEPFTGMLADLATVTHGAVGASRAVVDAGWAPHSQQVGQTGRSVRPRLYFAIAISGAIQHRVGMQTAGTIIAINKDGNIPIADIADLLVIGDAFSLVPELTRQLRQQKGLL